MPRELGYRRGTDIALQLTIKKDDGNTKVEFPRVSVKCQVVGVLVHEYCPGGVTYGATLNIKAFRFYGLTVATRAQRSYGNI